MQNIDPLYFLTPVVVIGFSFGLVAYLWAKKRFSRWVLLTSLAAYAGAIALKSVFQALTYGSFDSAVGGNAVPLGIYFGLQTAVFEVGGAFLVARYAAARKKLGGRDAAGFGVGLAMWENGVLVGGALLLDYLVYYAILASGGSQGSQLFDDLAKSAPSLFYGPSGALPLIGYAVLERVSSLLVHLAWGYLAVMAAVTGRKVYLGVALPMGLVDFIVPLSGSVGLGISELLFFAFGAVCLGVALLITRETRRVAGAQTSGTPTPMDTGSLVRTTMKRAVSFGKVYLGMGILLPLVAILPLTQIPSSGARASALVGELPALIIPMFAIIGSIGSLLVFTSDRSKGVFEYLIAYGVETSTIFWSTIAATLGLVSISLTFEVAEAVVGLYLGGGVTPGFIELVVFYTVPLSFAGAAFMCTAGMVWSALTTQMAGVNSPVGVAPLLGVAPVIVVLLVATNLGGDLFLYAVGSASLLLILASAGMVYLGTKKMVRERLLSSG